MASLTILRAGPLTTLQDLGRAAHRHEGVSLGGALDRHAARVANLLVGNEETAALLEISLGRTALRFSDDRIVAWCGGEFQFEVAGEKLPAGHACALRADETIEIAPIGRGCRAWLAIAGGIDVPLVLGSRATDLRAGFGGWQGRALADGDELPLGAAAVVMEKLARVSAWSAPLEWSRTAPSFPVLHFVPGAEWNELSETSRAVFLNQPFHVSPNCDRMGVRLEGHALTRAEKQERLSEPVVPGTVQLPEDGQPILLLGDCQTIGGYPRIAHVITADLAIAAQLRPDDSVRFQQVTPAEAVAAVQARAHDLERFRVGLRLRWR
jgi:antagonist of KipI